MTIGASKHYSAAPRQAGQDFSGVPRAHQFLVTLTVHTNKINPDTTPTATSAASMKNGHPAVVIHRDGQQNTLATKSSEVQPNLWASPSSAGCRFSLPALSDTIVKAKVK
ncbi:hypothetical protein [Mycolicibacterium agri]|uniref:Uncharacterized protein n=1 Tax=Mycolicibacterium agri TaxID=36811 RepID=A0A7I9W1P4_MYCAG|nr:hypothetical protein [Mycolicibacterium agri]GFG51602.1 hypothetical protein MAGR_30430 [Mycolicibacterium agri]